MEECKSTDYWATTYPGQTVFVSIITEYSHCSFNTRKDVRLVDEVSAKLFIHSSCGRNENGGALVQKKNNGGTGIRMRMNKKASTSCKVQIRFVNEKSETILFHNKGLCSINE